MYGVIRTGMRSQYNTQIFYVVERTEGDQILVETCCCVILYDSTIKYLCR